MAVSAGFNTTLHADYSASDCPVACLFSRFGIAGSMTVDPADMKSGDKRVAADARGRSRSRNTKSDNPNAQQKPPTIMKAKASEFSKPRYSPVEMNS